MAAEVGTYVLESALYIIYDHCGSPTHHPSSVLDYHLTFGPPCIITKQINTKLIFDYSLGSRGYAQRVFGRARRTPPNHIYKVRDLSVHLKFSRETSFLSRNRQIMTNGSFRKFIVCLSVCLLRHHT